jgi:hypothetical protein
MTNAADAAQASGQYCRLLIPVRDHEGRTRFDERPIVLRHIRNLDRSMYLVQFSDGATTFLFPNEIALDHEPLVGAAEKPAGHRSNGLHLGRNNSLHFHQDN